MQAAHRFAIVGMWMTLSVTSRRLTLAVRELLLRLPRNRLCRAIVQKVAGPWMRSSFDYVLLDFTSAEQKLLFATVLS